MSVLPPESLYHFSGATSGGGQSSRTGHSDATVLLRNLYSTTDSEYINGTWCNS